MADDFLFGPANAASVFATIKFGHSGEIECFVVGVLSNRQSKA
jgi:hypothetical protein